jgi:hypothetical protein
MSSVVPFCLSLFSNPVDQIWFRGAISDIRNPIVARNERKDETNDEKGERLVSQTRVEQISAKV